MQECADMCREMSRRYDADIEGCDGEQMIAYSEGCTCCNRLAEIFDKDEMKKWIEGGLK